MTLRFRDQSPWCTRSIGCPATTRRRAQIRHEVARVIGLVRRDGEPLLPGAAFDHDQRRVPFAVAVRRCDRGMDDRPRPMLSLNSRLARLALTSSVLRNFTRTAGVYC